MLFYTWPFLIFMLIVLPGYFCLRRTRFWILWLLAASYFFYGWWNPYYLLLVVYSTALDYLLVALMDHCPSKARPLAGSQIDDANSPILQYESPEASANTRQDTVLKAALIISSILAITLVAAAIAVSIASDPTLASLRPALLAFATLVLLMAAGAGLASRRAWLVISVINNLALLLFFKYAGFVEQNLNQVLAALHLAYRFPNPGALMPRGWAYALPVGISFFTFQSMSYTIDFYLGKAPRERNFFRFATFVCFFPQLMAGPIERARQILPQFQKSPSFHLEDITDGMSLFLVGLFKKVALADYLAIYVDRIYDTPRAYDATMLVLGTVAFAWQIFFDFSGYTDMARGVARMMGFNLVLNFNNPYLASGLGEFWSRWHISLSTWFRDYVYIPLGGNRRGTLATYRNLFITFLISGIWHGAAWTFAIWGILHAAGVMLTRELERSTFYRDRVPLAVKRIWVFAYVCFAWIFFRANSLSDAGLILGRIFTAGWERPQVPALMLLLVGSVWLYQSIYETRLRGLLQYGPLRVGMAIAMMLYLGFCSVGGQPFIYFQF